MKHHEVTDRIIQAFYKVYKSLGYGFLEKVYENAMVIELRKETLNITPQSPIKVYYDDQIIGEDYADL
jgi:GxxExxY protein